MKQVSIKRMSTRFGLKCEFDIYSRFKESPAFKQVKGKFYEVENKRWLLPIKELGNMCNLLKKVKLSYSIEDDEDYKIKVTRVDDELQMKAPYSDEIYKVVKQIDGYKWNSEKKLHTFPLDEHDNLWDKLIEANLIPIDTCEVENDRQSAKENNLEQFSPVDCKSPIKCTALTPPSSPKIFNRRNAYKKPRNIKFSQKPLVSRKINFEDDEDQRE